MLASYFNWISKKHAPHTASGSGFLVLSMLLITLGWFSKLFLPKHRYNCTFDYFIVLCCLTYFAVHHLLPLINSLQPLLPLLRLCIYMKILKFTTCRLVVALCFASCCLCCQCCQIRVTRNRTEECTARILRVRK